MLNKIKKIIFICISLGLLLTTTVAGTLAFETWNAEEYAFHTAKSGGSVAIEIITQQRSHDAEGNLILADFTDNKILVPLTQSAQYNGTNFDEFGMPMADGYVDQIVRIQNTGSESAYVRLVVAVPSVLDNVTDAGKNILHWNLGNRFMPDGNFSSQNNVNTHFNDITCRFTGTAVVEDNQCNLYTFTYATPLQSGHITPAAAFTGFYLDKDVNVVDGRIMIGDTYTGYNDNTVKIAVRAQAVQSYGFSDATTAFTANNTPSNPWENSTPIV